MIIAILKAGQLEGKIKLPQILREVDIILPVVLKAILDPIAMPSALTTTPRLRFTYWRRISRFKHEYRLQEII